MALTLIEAAKLETGDVYRQAIIEQFAASAGILMHLPFEDIPGNALKYNREETLPGVGFRGVNEAYQESTGILNPIMEPLVIAGGDLDVDRYIVRTMGEDQRSVQEMMKVKALALAWERTFFKGDMETDKREFDGMQKRITGTQLLTVDTPTAGGDALSLLLLDALIDQVRDATHLFMSKSMRRLLTQAARNKDVGGIITWTTDTFGRQVAMYNELPIVTVTNDNDDQPILGFNEVGPGGGSPVCTSIYCVSLGNEGVVGIQNGGMEVMDLGMLQEKPVYRTRIEWLTGLAVFNGKSAARLAGIKNAPVVV